MSRFNTYQGATALALTSLLLFFGCGKPQGPPTPEVQSDSDGHGQSEDAGSHDGHDHEHEEDTSGSPDHDQSKKTPLGSIEIGGTTFSVFISEINPESVVNVDLEVEAGPAPTAIRFWIGDKAGTGSLKSKASAHDSHFHGETEAPTDLSGASLWIEAESADGKRHAESVSLPK